MSLMRLPILRHGLTVWDRSVVSESEIAERHARIRAAMRDFDLDLLLIYGDLAWSGDGAYVTNFHPFDARMPGLAVMTSADLDSIMKVTSRDLQFVSKFTWGTPHSCDFLSGDLDAKLAEIVAERGLSGKRAGIVGGGRAPFNLVRRIERMFDGGLRDVDGLLRALRRQKSGVERTILRTAAAKAEWVLSEIVTAVSPGLREGQLAARADYAARLAGAQDTEFLLHVDGSDDPPGRGADHLPFRPALDGVLPPAGGVAMFLALQLHGYWVELSQTVFVAPPSPVQLEAYQFASAAFQDMLTGAIRPGSTGRGQPGRAWIHGIGLDREEAPLPVGRGDLLVEGDVIACHLAVEHLGTNIFMGRSAVVTGSGAQRLAAASTEPAVSGNAA